MKCHTKTVTLRTFLTTFLIKTLLRLIQFWWNFQVLFITREHIFWGILIDADINTIQLRSENKKKSSFFFKKNAHVYSPGQGQTTYWGQNFDDNRKGFSLAHMWQVSKWSLRNLILYTFLMTLYIYIAPGQGHTTPWEQTFDVNRKSLSLCPFIASLKKNLILYAVLMIL